MFSLLPSLMSEISLEDLDPRWQAQVAKVQAAAVKGDHAYVIAVCERLLEAFPGCLEVRRLLRQAQHGRMRKNTSGFSRWLGGVGVQFRSGGLSRKDPAKAMLEAEAALGRAPDNIPAHRLLGEAALALDLPATAVFAFECIRDLDTTDRANLRALGRALIKADRADEAMRLAEAMLADKAGDSEVERLLKDASVAHSLAQGNWERGGNYRDKLARAAEAESLEASARSAESDGGARARAARLEAAIAEEPEQLGRYRGLAGVWRQLGEPRPALEWIRRARSLPVGASDPSLAELEGLLQGELLQQRVATARAASGNRPDDSEARDELAAAESALQTFQRKRLGGLVEQYPNDPGYRLELGDLLLKAGEASDAAVHFQRVVNDPSRRTAALLGLARAFKFLQKLDLARDQIEWALEANLTMNEVRKSLLYEKADIADALGRADEAKAAFQAIYAVDLGYRDVATRLDSYDRGGESAGRG